MASSVVAAIVVLICAGAQGVEQSNVRRDTTAEDLADVVFYGDLGKAREYKDYLVSPWPMDKSAQDGAFSLYEGMYDYIVNQGARPKDALILGDVGYYGGDAKGLQYNKAAHEKYFDGKVPSDRVWPVIGNHDIHYLGCTQLEMVHAVQDQACYYGTKTGRMLAGFFSQPQMTYSQWIQNWMDAYPGLKAHGILPQRQDDKLDVSEWPAPMRYNIDPGKDSSVYIIVGLVSGCHQTKWQDDTPLGAYDGMVKNTGVECAFLRDSLAHGRSLGKTIFIYATHHFNNACEDWSLIKQIDVWLYGHKHTYWQSMENGGKVVQEQRHYPARILIGNSGFDEANINVVNFGRLREEVFQSERDGTKRVRLHFDIKDTCVTSESFCPMMQHHKNVNFLKKCWLSCKNFTGGFDGGGGPRKAIPSTHGSGFTFEAPLQASNSLPEAPFGGTWKIRLGSGDSARWLSIGTCSSKFFPASGCLVSTANANDALGFTIYDATGSDAEGKARVRLAVENAKRGPVKQQTECDLLGQGDGFWNVESVGFGLMSPSDGFLFDLSKSKDDSWQIEGVQWQTGHADGNMRLAVAQGGVLSAQFTSPPPVRDAPLDETVEQADDEEFVV